MNNKPVAWIDEINTFVLDKDYQQFPKSLQHGMIPLYTHPVKEHDLGISHAIGFDDGFKAGMQRAVEMNVVKELTEEEVYQTWQEAKNTALTTGNSNPVEVIFAKAILRKAREK
jgi:hypothetical protein